MAPLFCFILFFPEAFLKFCICPMLLRKSACLSIVSKRLCIASSYRICLSLKLGCEFLVSMNPRQATLTVSSTPKRSTICLFLLMDLSISMFMGKSLWLVDQPFCFSLYSSVPETLPDLSLLSPIQFYISKPGNNLKNERPVARQERSNEFGDKIIRTSYGDSLTSFCSFLWVFIHKDNFPFLPVHSLSLSFPLSVSYSLSFSHILGILSKKHALSQK